MRKNTLIFGLISGALITSLMLYSVSACYNNRDFQSNDVLGFAAIIVAFSFIFIGIKNYRDKYNGGVITFGKAFKTGLFIAFVAATCYVGVWLIDYYLFIPDFMDKYIPHVLKEAGRNGATQAELNEKAAQMEKFRELYKNPLLVVVISYFEVFPLGAIIALISALILKRKANVVADGAVKFFSKS